MSSVKCRKPGKFSLDAPTTVIQAIAMAGSWNIGANLREVVVFRRDSEWRLMATRVNVRPALYNSRDLCADDIWLRDSDIVIVTKCPLQVMDDYINLLFTRGIYGVVPFTATVRHLQRHLVGRRRRTVHLTTIRCDEPARVRPRRLIVFSNRSGHLRVSSSASGIRRRRFSAAPRSWPANTRRPPGLACPYRQSRARAIGCCRRRSGRRFRRSG